MNMFMIAVGFFIMQKFVTSYGASASAAYGIALRIEQIILLPAIGFSSALLSMVGQNFIPINQTLCSLSSPLGDKSFFQNHVPFRNC